MGKKGLMWLLLLCFLCGCERGEVQGEARPCVLCGNGNGSRRQAPCVVKISTGEVGELTVYDPHPWLKGEVAEEQRTGTFSFLFCGDLAGYRDTGDHTSHLILPEENEPMDLTYFCESCQSLLNEVSDGSYVLLDLYDLDHIEVFAVRDGANYTIRDYDVSVIRDEGKGKFLIHVKGNRDQENRDAPAR